MTLEDQIRNAIHLWEDFFAERGGYEGRDWFHLSKCEVAVFQIDPKRFPAMITAWRLYECLLGITRPEDSDFESVAIEQERARWPDLKERCTNQSEFAEIAVQRVGLTHREAHAMFYKFQFWEVRYGAIQYPDEA